MYAGNSKGAVSSQWRASEMYAKLPAWHAPGPKSVTCACAREDETPAEEEPIDPDADAWALEEGMALAQGLDAGDLM